MIEISLKFPAMNYTFDTQWWASTTISKQEYVLKNIFKVGLADVKLTYKDEELWNNIPLRIINPDLTPMDIFIEFDIDDSDELEVFVPAPPKPKSQPKPKIRYFASKPKLIKKKRDPMVEALINRALQNRMNKIFGTNL